MTYSVLSCPPNYIWQAFLEAQFPGRAKELSPTEKELIVDEVVTGTGTGAEINDANGDLSKRHVEEKTMAEKSEDATTTTGPLSESKKTKKLNLKNTAIKFSLDQTLGSAINVRNILALRLDTHANPNTSLSTDRALHHRHRTPSRPTSQLPIQKSPGTILAHDFCRSETLARSLDLKLYRDSSATSNAVRVCRRAFLGCISQSHGRVGKNLKAKSARCSGI